MKTYYLAVDIGASSGRHILGWIEDGKIQLEEVYRFPNGVTEQNGHLIWDVAALTHHVKEGIAKAKELLGTTDLGVKDVSLACGYADSSYFARVFKRLVGQTPSDYRQSIQGPGMETGE